LGDMEVKVLGTSFNVSAYPGVKRQTTLIEGQVAVNWHRQQVVIRPGQQAVETDEGLRVASVNVMNYVGWKEHRFVYENKLLGEVLEDLERWYDVEVFVMHDEIRNLHLTANLPKYENMDKVLEIIEYAACVKFEVKGRTVVVRRD
jgi:transmembrane sensor